MVLNKKKHRKRSHLIIHFPTSEEVSEWARAREWSEYCGASECVSEWAVRAKGRASGPVLQFLGWSGPQCSRRASFVFFFLCHLHMTLWVSVFSAGCSSWCLSEKGGRTICIDCNQEVPREYDTSFPMVYRTPCHFCVPSMNLLFFHEAVFPSTFPLSHLFPFHFFFSPHYFLSSHFFLSRDFLPLACFFPLASFFPLATFSSPLSISQIFVGGLSQQTSSEDLRNYFSRYGEVKECFIKIDPVTNRGRGFGFVTFSEPDAIDRWIGVAERNFLPIFQSFFSDSVISFCCFFFCFLFSAVLFLLARNDIPLLIYENLLNGWEPLHLSLSLFLSASFDNWGHRHCLIEHFHVV